MPDSSWTEPVSYAEADKNDQEQTAAGSLGLKFIFEGKPTFALLQPSKRIAATTK